ncbi:MAG: hypothetical protein RL367_1368 [Pseudomonadota bacterium]
MKGVAPGGTIGIIGGGQLGRMLALAAAQLGYRSHIFAPEAGNCAAEVANDFTCGAYDDRAALARFASAVDVATFEFENIDADPLEEVASRVALYPPLAALRVGQDRVAEKTFAQSCGGRPADWMAVASRDDLDQAVRKIGLPAILKTTRFGYDGKGQFRLKHTADIDPAWVAMGGQPLILEAMVPFAHEFSLIVARDQAGTIAFWDAPENVHSDGILATSTIPATAAIIREQTPAARGLARRIAEKLNYVGVFAIEFFAGRDGPVFNEMAPRVHNSGHWTIEGAVISQFENHIRCVVGMTLGATSLTARTVRMTNLVGDQADDWQALTSDPAAHVHLYNKGEARPGRKMGHVTHCYR